MCKYTYNPERSYPKGTPFTYLISWTDLNISYYGVRYAKNGHPNDLWTKYFTSSKQVKHFRNENGEPDLIKVDYIFDTKEESIFFEYEYIRENNLVQNPNWLNLSNGSKTFYRKNKFYKLSEEHKKKIGDSNRGQKRTPEQIRQNSERQIGRKPSLETLQKMSDSHKGLKRSAEAIKKSADSNRGQKRTPETCKNISNAKKGKIPSSEHIIKSSNSRRGLKKSSETKQKIRETNLGQKRTPETCNNIANSLKGKFWITNLDIKIFVFPEEAKILYSFGFLKGTLINIYK